MLWRPPSRIGWGSVLYRHGVPTHRNDLLKHRCIQIRIGDESVYRWEFERGAEKLEVNVPGKHSCVRSCSKDARRRREREGSYAREDCYLDEVSRAYLSRAVSMHKPSWIATKSRRNQARRVKRCGRGLTDDPSTNPIGELPEAEAYARRDHDVLLETAAILELYSSSAQSIR